MATQIKAYPIVTSAINMFGDWLRHRQEMREMREIDRGDFARIAHDLSVSPAELDILVRRGPHASDELPKLLNVSRNRRGGPVSHPASPAAGHGARLRCLSGKGQM